MIARKRFGAGGGFLFRGGQGREEQLGIGRPRGRSKPSRL
jgi:hypothetical protein